MKRIKERYDDPFSSNPIFPSSNTQSNNNAPQTNSQQNQEQNASKSSNPYTHASSGLRVFGGEDLARKDREKLHRVQQGAWLNEQKSQIEKREKEREAQEEKRRAKDRETQLKREKLEDEHRRKVMEMNLNTFDYNKKLAEEKKIREKKQREDEIHSEINYIKEAESARQNYYNNVKSTLDEKRKKY